MAPPVKPPIDVPHRVVARKRAPKAAAPATSPVLAPVPTPTPARRVVGLSNDGAYRAAHAMAAAAGVADPLARALLGVLGVALLGERRLVPAPAPAAPARRARPRRKPARPPTT